MRVGLIADLHGNKLALEAVLDQLDRQRIDRIICLGDVTVLGPDPSGVMRLLRAREIPVVMGNTDAWLFGPPRPDPIFAGLTRWTRAQLTAADLAMIKAFPPTLHAPLDGESSLLACHGSPRSYDEVISALTPDDRLAEAIAGHDEPIIAGGHTHVPLLRRFSRRHLINPGAVGLPGIGPGTADLPVNADVAWAEYGVIEFTTPQAHAVTFHRIPIDLTALFAAADATGMPHLDWWKRLWRTSSAGEQPSESSVRGPEPGQ